MKKNLILSAVSFSICFLILEGLFRLIAPYSPPGTTYGKALKRNSDIFRDREFLIPKPTKTYRILVLGDSFTWGIGLDIEETIPKQLERNLNKQFLNKNIEVVNASIPGYNTVQELILLKDKGLRYEPNMVVLIYNLNDIEYLSYLSTTKYDDKKIIPVLEIDHNENINKFSEKKGIRNFIGWFEKKSKFITFLVPRIGYILRKIGLLESLEFSWVQKIFQGYTDENPGWLESKNALQEISNICNKNDITFIVAIYPLLVSLDNYKGKLAHEAIHTFCNNFNIPSIDLLSVFENKNGRSFWINYMDGHPNAEAHHLVQDALLPIVEHYILKSPDS